MSLSSHFPIIAATFASHFFSFGPIYAFGVFVPVLKDHFDISLDAAATAHSLMIGAQFIGSLLAGLLMPHRVGHRIVNLTGAVVVLAGYSCASLANRIEVVYVALGIFVGVGLGACNLAGLTALNARVTKDRALAVGIATSGTSVATMLLPPIYTALLDAVGWRWAFRLSGITTGLVLAGITPLVFVEREKVVNNDVISSKSERRLPCADKRYMCWWSNMLICFLGYFAPVTLLAQFTKEILKESPGVAAKMYTIIGVCAFLTRVSLGCITKHCRGARFVHFCSQLTNGLLVIVLPYCWSVESLAVWSALYGFSVGPVIALISVILSELFGTRMLPFYHGYSRLAVGLGTFAGPPFIAYIAESQGYRLACALAGGLIVVACNFLLLLAWLQSRFESNPPKPSQSSKGEIDERIDDAVVEELHDPNRAEEEAIPSVEDTRCSI
mmetsp:Transcript_3214/g.5266  ORF Transcript_3214/g.5266 Transcript_3214/m.5266 type:complete len:442 (+) Transcript_3214:46-1371(+)